MSKPKFGFAAFACLVVFAIAFVPATVAQAQGRGGGGGNGGGPGNQDVPVTVSFVSAMGYEIQSDGAPYVDGQDLMRAYINSNGTALQVLFAGKKKDDEIRGIYVEFSDPETAGTPAPPTVPDATMGHVFDLRKFNTGSHENLLAMSAGGPVDYGHLTVTFHDDDDNSWWLRSSDNNPPSGVSDRMMITCTAGDPCTEWTIVPDPGQDARLRLQEGSTVDPGEYAEVFRMHYMMIVTRQ